MKEEKNISVGDIGRLIRLIAEVADREECSPTEAVETVSRMMSVGTSEVRRKRLVVAEYIARIRLWRARRNERIGASLFRDPAWDMLLELFVAHERDEELTATSLCHASGVPATTALRYLQRLEEEGLVVRKGHRRDSRLSIVKPTAKAIASVANMAAMLLDEKEMWAPLLQSSESSPTTITERFAHAVWGPLTED